jgi:transposase
VAGSLRCVGWPWASRLIRALSDACAGLFARARKRPPGATQPRLPRGARAPGPPSNGGASPATHTPLRRGSRELAPAQWRVRLCAGGPDVHPAGLVAPRSSLGAWCDRARGHACLPYTTDLTDEEWQILKPLLPPEKAAGRPRKYPMREVLNGIQSVLRAGCTWRLMPHDLPHWQTAYQTLRAWRQDGTWQRSHEQWRDVVRTRMGRHPHPSAAIIEAQPVKTTAKGGRMAMMRPSVVVKKKRTLS